MNIIQVKIDFEQGTCQKQGISVVTGDYNSTKIEFEFNESATGTKIFEMKDPNDNLVYADEIIDNEVVLVGYKEEEGEIETYSLFGEEGDYTFEVSLYQNNGKLTSVCDYITAEKEQVIVDGEEVQERITLFDNLMNELSQAIVETNNLDLDAEKVDTTTTVVLTKKDGTQKTIEILDGEQGPQGEPGQPGAIKWLIVEELPEVGSEDTLYFVPKEDAETSDLYYEYAWVSNQWELLGEKQIVVDLTDYVKNTDYATTTKGGVIIVNSQYGTSMDAGQLAGASWAYSAYQSKGSNLIISKGTLENVITGKGIVDSTKIKTSQSTTNGEVYDVTYINSLIGDINSALDTINGEVI